MIDNMAEARQALTEATMDVEADHGAAKVDEAWADIVRVVADRCTLEVSRQLLYANGLGEGFVDSSDNNWGAW